MREGIEGCDVHCDSGDVLDWLLDGEVRGVFRGKVDGVNWGNDLGL